MIAHRSLSWPLNKTNLVFVSERSMSHLMLETFFSDVVWQLNRNEIALGARLKHISFWLVDSDWLKRLFSTRNARETHERIMYFPVETIERHSGMPSTNELPFENQIKYSPFMICFCVISFSFFILYEN